MLTMTLYAITYGPPEASIEVLRSSLSYQTSHTREVGGPDRTLCYAGRVKTPQDLISPPNADALYQQNVLEFHDYSKNNNEKRRRQPSVIVIGTHFFFNNAHPDVCACCGTVPYDTSQEGHRDHVRMSYSILLKVFSCFPCFNMHKTVHNLAVQTTPRNLLCNTSPLPPNELF